MSATLAFPDLRPAFAPLSVALTHLEDARDTLAASLVPLRAAPLPLLRAGLVLADADAVDAAAYRVAVEAGRLAAHMEALGMREIDEVDELEAKYAGLPVHIVRAPLSHASTATHVVLPHFRRLIATARQAARHARGTVAAHIPAPAAQMTDDPVLAATAPDHACGS